MEGRTSGWWGLQGMMSCAEETRGFDLPHLLISYRCNVKDIEVLLWCVDIWRTRGADGPKIKPYIVVSSSIDWEFDDTHPWLIFDSLHLLYVSFVHQMIPMCMLQLFLINKIVHLKNKIGLLGHLNH